MKCKCAYWKSCKLYDENGVVCNEHNGMYYSIDKPAGCFRRKVYFEEQDARDFEKLQWQAEQQIARNKQQIARNKNVLKKLGGYTL